MLQTAINTLKALPILSGFVRREVDKVLVCKHFLIFQLPPKHCTPHTRRWPQDSESPDVQTVCIYPNPLCILLSCQAQTTAAHYYSVCIVPHLVHGDNLLCCDSPSCAAECQNWSFEPQPKNTLPIFYRSPYCCHHVSLMLCLHHRKLLSADDSGWGLCRARWWLVCQSRLILRTLR